MLKSGSPPRSDPSGESPQGRLCAFSGCQEAGLYPAPKTRNQLRDYVWLCLDHVREYNRAWDYYAGMSVAEIEAEMRADVTWQRQTWPLGSWRLHEQRVRDNLYGGGDSPFGRHGWDGESHGAAEGGSSAGLPQPEVEALHLLGLDRAASFAEIKARYRELAKKHHPDANGGDKAAEEQLKKINQAYTILKASHGP